jgi:ribosomal protein L16 Arg81 hydroxylase
MAGFSQRLQDLFGGQITGINQLQQETITALQATVARLEQMASDVQASGTKATDAMAERLAQAMTSVEARQEALNRRMGEFLEQLRQLTRESQSETNQKLHEILDALGVKVGEMVTQLQTQSAQAAVSHTDREERAAQRPL